MVSNRTYLSFIVEHVQGAESEQMPWYKGLFISLMIAGLTIIFSVFVLVPRMRRRIEEEKAANSGTPKSPPRLSIRQTKFAKDSQLEGHDNAVFEGDDRTTTKRDEISLDPSKLMDKPNETTSARVSSTTKPSIAPKPAHLRQSKPVQELEEIDLSTGNTTKQVVIDTGDNGNKKKRASDQVEEEQSDEIDIAKLFSSLQIMTACFASFAHGTNDVSNAVTPLVPIWNIYANGKEDIAEQTPVWILLFGGIGICTGLWAWGRSVMATVGEGLTKLTPAKGFAIELGAAMAVLAATKIGIPISTTHCKVGAVVIVGLVSSKYLSLDNVQRDSTASKTNEQTTEKPVDWKLFLNIAITWVLTVPAAAGSSALMMLILKWFAL